MVRTRRTLALTLLAALVLVPSLASARPAASPSRTAVRVQPAASSADPLARLWHGLRNLWGSEGMTIDPNGARIAGQGTAGQTSSGLASGAGMPVAPNG